MAADRPYPLDQPELTLDVKKLLEPHGAQFNGENWLLMEEMFYPYREVFFLTAIDPEAVSRSRDTVLIGFELFSTPSGFVWEATIGYEDDPVNPTVVATLLNPATAEVRRWIRMLISQNAINVLQLDRNLGTEISTIRVSLDADDARVLEQTLSATTEDASPSADKWRAAVAAFRDRRP